MKASEPLNANVKAPEPQSSSVNAPKLQNHVKIHPNYSKLDSKNKNSQIVYKAA